MLAVKHKFFNKNIQDFYSLVRKHSSRNIFASFSAVIKSISLPTFLFELFTRVWAVLSPRHLVPILDKFRKSVLKCLSNQPTS